MTTDSSAPGSGQHATDADLRAPGAKEEGPKAGAQSKKHVLAGKYLLEREIARGAMGRVFLATQLSLKRRVAVKVMAPKYGGPDFAQRFMLEARSAAALSHRNIVTVHDYGRTKNNLLFMAMEYLDGPTLRELIEKEGKLDFTRAGRIVQQIARALRAAHGMGLVHRDLKPGNVIVVQDPDEGDFAKVLDFGLAKVQPAGDLDEGDGPVTRDGLMIGTPRYISPEQIKLEAVDERTDIYALGAILYFLITGQHAYDGPTDVEILHAQLAEDPPSVSATPGCEDVPPEIDAVIRRCMARDPAQRFQRAFEVIEALQNVVMTPDVEPVAMGEAIEEPKPRPGVEPEPDAPIAAPGGGRANLFAAVAIVVALVGGGVGWVSMTPPPTAPEIVEKVKPRPARVAVLTEPEGLETVSVTGAVLGVTPFIIELERPTTVRFRKEGRQSAPETLTPDGGPRAAFDFKAEVRKWEKIPK